MGSDTRSLLGRPGEVPQPPGRDARQPPRCSPEPGNALIQGAAGLRVIHPSIVLACCLFAAGCACLQRTEPAVPGVAHAPVAVAPVAPVAPGASGASGASAPPRMAAPPVVASRSAPPTPPIKTVVPQSRAAAPTSPAAAVAPGSAPTSTVVATTVQPAAAMPKAAAVQGSAKPTAAPLDFKALETRLRQTRAIGVLTKLSLKNQVEDLLARVRAYHERHGSTTLGELRRNYDMLLLKVLSLLQDTDPPLARDIVKSRAAMWRILEDPGKFNEFNRMAGATQ
jgi:hypothetical protein